MRDEEAASPRVSEGHGTVGRRRRAECTTGATPATCTGGVRLLSFVCARFWSGAAWVFTVFFPVMNHVRDCSPFVSDSVMSYVQNIYFFKHLNVLGERNSGADGDAGFCGVL